MVLGKDCQKVDQCSCKFDDGSVVDITSLGNQDNSPRYESFLWGRSLGISRKFVIMKLDCVATETRKRKLS